MWSSKVRQQLLLTTKRNISSTAAVSVSHYDVLGITPKATQAEVKAAYYKLSKLHHPDTTSKKDEDNGNQFRLITEAYEVLGNYRSRQLYDKGLYGHSRLPERKKDVTSDHPKMAFYKSRFDKSRLPTSQLSKGIYDFDEWTRQHYSESFAKQNASKQNQRKANSSRDPREVIGDEGLMRLSLAGAFLVILGSIVMNLSSSAYDSPHHNEISDKPA